MTEEAYETIRNVLGVWLSSIGPKGSGCGESRSHRLQRELEQNLKKIVFPMIEDGNLEEALDLSLWLYEYVIQYSAFDEIWEPISQDFAITWLKLRAHGDDVFVDRMNEIRRNMNAWSSFPDFLR